MSPEEKVGLFREKLATALKMDMDDHLRPKVTVQARGRLAEKLIELAEEHQVPIMKDVELAKDLQFLEVGSALPVELFSPVAEILAHLYTLSSQAKKEGLSTLRTD